MKIIITGSAGFIGYHLAINLLSKGIEVIGIDNLNDYYDISLKKSRLNNLEKFDNFSFHQIDVNDSLALNHLLSLTKNITHIIHLAAQAGVRNSIDFPLIYSNNNINGLINIMEEAKNISSLEHVIFASSSSVYGDNTKLPFTVSSLNNQPSSVYAATKIAGEAIAYSYSHIYKIPITSLRFFTVYGPYGRPDMAIYKFTKAILENTPITLYEQGKLKRDFTYIDDIVNGIIGSIKNKKLLLDLEIPYKNYNLGRGENVELLHCLSLIEASLGKKANVIFAKMPNTEIRETLADISVSQEELGFNPIISIEQGIEKFCNWYTRRELYQISEPA